MVNVAPFKGILYNQKKVADLSEVVTPPYDVIIPQEQEKFYQRNDHNFVRLILGKQSSTDTPEDNRYTRAAKYFSAWTKEKVLVQDSQPAIYLYQQRFDVHGEGKVRLGFIALLKLEDFSAGNILPHENTLSKPKADRLNLLRATDVNFEQIFLLYEDNKRVIGKVLEEALNRKPDIDTDDKDVNNKIRGNHKLWRIADQKSIKAIVEGMKDKKIYIADGHHRYETSLNYYREKKTEVSGYMSVCFVAMEDPGLVIFPTHRLLKELSNSELQKLTSQIGRYFVEEEIGSKDVNDLIKKMNEGGKHCFGVYMRGKFYLLRLKDARVVNQVIKEGSPAWRHLEVNVLHKLLLDSVIGSAKEIKEGKIAYTSDAEKAKERVDKEGYQLAFFLQPTKAEEVKKVSLAGEKMPQKSTYFYPKLLSGLVMHKLG